MKKSVLLCVAIALLCSCANNKVYRPSKFPDESGRRDCSFAIPYTQKYNSMIVRVRLNGGPEFEAVWDTGNSFPMKISMQEAKALEKAGTLSLSDYCADVPVTVADGSTSIVSVYKLKSVSFVDKDGGEHVINDVLAVVDKNPDTDILIGLPVMQELGYSHEISQYDQLIYFKE